MMPFHVFSRVGHHRTWRQQVFGTRKGDKDFKISPCIAALRVCLAVKNKYKNDPRHEEYREMLALELEENVQREP